MKLGKFKNYTTAETTRRIPRGGKKRVEPHSDFKKFTGSGSRAGGPTDFALESTARNRGHHPLKKRDTEGRGFKRSNKAAMAPRNFVIAMLGLRPKLDAPELLTMIAA